MRGCCLVGTLWAWLMCRFLFLLFHGIRSLRACHAAWVAPIFCCPLPSCPGCSDVTKGRILLPRAAVEANLSFAIGRAHSLLAQDHAGRAWEFTLQSWANGENPPHTSPLFGVALADMQLKLWW